MLPKIYDRSPMLGCDPEFFFKIKGKVIGSEKILPKDGLVCAPQSKFIIDGVQAELNPRPNACRANLANEIKACFAALDAKLKKDKSTCVADFSRTVKISRRNLMELDEQSRKFGCAPSKNVYKESGGIKIDKVNPAQYRTRAAGGHIHIGMDSYNSKSLLRALKEDYERTVIMLDLICGNTCVLVDPDKSNKVRRKLYGRAGEFRQPAHGLEYRTLSNFWLTSYPLMSLSFGLARMAVNMMADDTSHETFFKEFTSRVKADDVHKAINENNFKLAYKNFKAIEDLILEVTNATDRYPIHKGNMKEFHYFVDRVQNDGLEYWFKDNPMTHWIKIYEAHIGGFSDYLQSDVRNDMKKHPIKAKKTA